MPNFDELGESEKRRIEALYYILVCNFKHKLLRILNKNKIANFLEKNPYYTIHSKLFLVIRPRFNLFSIFKDDNASRLLGLKMDLLEKTMRRSTDGELRHLDEIEKIDWLDNNKTISKYVDGNEKIPIIFGKIGGESKEEKTSDLFEQIDTLPSYFKIPFRNYDKDMIFYFLSFEFFHRWMDFGLTMVAKEFFPFLEQFPDLSEAEERTEIIIKLMEYMSSKNFLCRKCWKEFENQVSAQLVGSQNLNSIYDYWREMSLVTPGERKLDIAIFTQDKLLNLLRNSDIFHDYNKCGGTLVVDDSYKSNSAAFGEEALYSLSTKLIQRAQIFNHTNGNLMHYQALFKNAGISLHKIDPRKFKEWL